MAIYYNEHEGGKIKKFPFSPQHSWAIEQLEKNVQICEIKEGEFPQFEKELWGRPFSGSMLLSFLCGVRVHAVFFIKYNKCWYIFDASLSHNGFRRPGWLRLVFSDNLWQLKNKDV